MEEEESRAEQDETQPRGAPAHTSPPRWTPASPWPASAARGAGLSGAESKEHSDTGPDPPKDADPIGTSAPPKDADPIGTTAPPKGY